MTCSLCEPIGAQQVANTGRDIYLGAPASSMTSLGPRDDDELRACPTCGDLFHYTSEQAQTGSGNNDNDTITRLSTEATATLNAARSASITIPLADLAARITALPPGPARVHAAAIIPDATLRVLVPAFLDQLVAGGDKWIGEIVRRIAKEDPPYVKHELAQRAGAAVLDPFRAHVRVVGCSICRAIPFYPPAPPTGLTPLKIDAQSDLFDCPECDSLFKTEGTKGGVCRVHDWLRDAVRACVRRSGTVPPAAMEGIARCGQDWQTLLDRYAAKYDGELAEQLRQFRANRKP